MAKSKTTGRWNADTIRVKLQHELGPITHLSREWGYSRQAITQVLRRSDYSVPLERRIAEALSIPAHELWPDRYAADGKPLPRPVAVAEGMRPRHPVESQKRAVA